MPIMPRLRPCYRCRSSCLSFWNTLYFLGVEDLFCFSLTIFFVFTDYLDSIYQLSENPAISCLQKNSSQKAIPIVKCKHQKNAYRYISGKCKQKQRYVVCVLTQLCPAVCDPVNYSPPGFSVHGILQARILEWVAISSSWESSQPRDRTCVSCIGKWILYL